MGGNKMWEKFLFSMFDKLKWKESKVGKHFLPGPSSLFILIQNREKTKKFRGNIKWGFNYEILEGRSDT